MNGLEFIEYLLTFEEKIENPIKKKALVLLYDFVCNDEKIDADDETETDTEPCMRKSIGERSNIINQLFTLLNEECSDVLCAKEYWWIRKCIVRCLIKILSVCT